jgi:hypothetical protein
MCAHARAIVLGKRVEWGATGVLAPPSGLLMNALPSCASVALLVTAACSPPGQDGAADAGVGGARGGAAHG